MASKVFNIAGKRIWGAGLSGMVGGAVMRRMSRAACEILTVAYPRG